MNVYGDGLDDNVGAIADRSVDQCETFFFVSSTFRASLNSIPLSFIKLFRFYTHHRRGVSYHVFNFLPPPWPNVNTVTAGEQYSGEGTVDRVYERYVRSRSSASIPSLKASPAIVTPPEPISPVLIFKADEDP